jgi:hypothetical protein
MPKQPLFFILAFFFLSCGVQREDTSGKEKPTGAAIPGPPVIIYKTKSNFNNLVPVMLNKEKTEVVGYPAPSDIRLSGERNEPVELEQGFLFDRRGIGPNSAFLEMTFDEYAGLSRALTPEELIESVIEPDPFVVMYRCDIRNDENVIEELNDLIRKFNFDRCKQLK